MEAIEENQPFQGEWAMGPAYGKQRKERREKREKPQREPREPREKRAKKVHEMGEVTTMEIRAKAMGREGDIPFDKCQVYMERNAESIFRPKEVTSSEDWLA